MDGLCNQHQKNPLVLRDPFSSVPLFLSCLSVKPHGSSQRRHEEFQPSLEVSRNLTLPHRLFRRISRCSLMLLSRAADNSIATTHPPWHYPPGPYLKRPSERQRNLHSWPRRWPVHHLLGPCRPGQGLNLHCPVPIIPQQRRRCRGDSGEGGGGERQGTDSRFNSAGLDSGSRPARARNESCEKRSRHEAPPAGDFVVEGDETNSGDGHVREEQDRKVNGSNYGPWKCHVQAPAFSANFLCLCCAGIVYRWCCCCSCSSVSWPTDSLPLVSSPISI